MLTLILISALSALDVTQSADIVWTASDVFCEPETVIVLPDETLMVSNVCDYRTDGNGYLTRLHADGSVMQKRAVEGLDAPLGMAVAVNQLLVIDRNRLHRLSWPNLDTVAVENLPTSVANDVAVGPAGEVYITDTARGEVIVLGPGSANPPSYLLGPGRFPGANGIAVSESFVYVGGERLWEVDLEKSTSRVVGPEELADIDGIEIEPDGVIQATPVGGPVVRLRDRVIVDVIGGEGISSANHGFAPTLGLILIPTGFDGTVIAVRHKR